MIEQWVEKGLISGTITTNGTGIVKRDDFDKVEDYIYDPRVIVNVTKKVELFFAIQSKHSVVKMVKSELEYYK